MNRVANQEQDPAAPAAATPMLRRSQWVMAALLMGGYALLSYYSGSRPDARGLGAGLSIGPVAAIAVFLAWRWLHPAVAFATTIAAAGLLYRYWGFLERNYEWADLLQQCGVYLLIALGFAHSLLKSRVPLCTQLALQLHADLNPAEIAYTRGATAAYAGFYLLIAAAIFTLFFAVTAKSWSFFVNFATYGLIILACLIDAAIRRAVLPRRANSGVVSMLRRSLIG